LLSGEGSGTRSPRRTGAIGINEEDLLQRVAAARDVVHNYFELDA
jgi:hypothetical protein